VEEEKPKPLHNPHDAFVKAGLGEPHQMADFLRAYLPTALTTAVDWKSLQRVESEFLDEELHQRHADLLFRARFRQDTPVYFHLLFEHQKTVDPWMPLRLLTYQVHIWNRFRKESPKAKHLPPILPIVFFQDRRRWPRSPALRDLFGLPQELDPSWLEYLPDYRHAIINLSDLELEAINHNLALRVMMKVLDAILEPDAAHSLRTGLQTLLDLESAPDQQTFLRTCLTYLIEAGKTLDRKTLDAIVSGVESARLQEVAMSIADQLRLEGRREGRREGEGIGKIIGERLLLQRQMTRKFGELDYLTQEKINRSSEADLERWAERILDAKTLAEVFTG
jgi:predicted transposase/invertase (TIGR01784 family)